MYGRFLNFNSTVGKKKKKRKKKKKTKRMRI